MRIRGFLLGLAALGAAAGTVRADVPARMNVLLNVPDDLTNIALNAGGTR